MMKPKAWIINFYLDNIPSHTAKWQSPKSANLKWTRCHILHILQILL
jgi:hypothetical protein